MCKFLKLNNLSKEFSITKDCGDEKIKDIRESSNIFKIRPIDV